MEQKFVNKEIAGIRQSNLEKLKQLFPSVVKDGQVDFEELKNQLGNFEEIGQEKYEFNWVGKQEAKQIAISEISGVTLKYYPEESKEADTTENLYIEGDNLKVLKLLRNNYANKIKMIYIDPPYNTGNDTFVYPDNFKKTEEESKEEVGITKDGEKVINILKDNIYKNTKDSNKYHSAWTSMMYPRLKIAQELLCEDGIIFISIDDNEVDNLRKVCDEIFSPQNFIAQIIIEGTPKNDPYVISTAHEYCLVYVKDFETAKEKDWGIKNELYKEILEIYEKGKQDYETIEKNLKEFYKANKLEDDNIHNYKFADKHGIYRIGPIDDPQGGAKDDRYNPYTKEKLVTPEGGWRCNLDTWNEWVEKELIAFPEDNTKLCAKKTYLSEDRKDLLRSVYKMQTRKDTKMLEELFGKKVFQYPKPVEFIKMLIDSSTQKDSNDIILDFFSGSGTTADAVMEMNTDGGNRRYILVQLPEDLEENFKKTTGKKEQKILKNAIEYLKEHNKKTVLSEIGKERIRLRADQLKQKTDLDIDLGFKVFKLEETNINWEKEEYKKNIDEYILRNGFIDEKQKEELIKDFAEDAKDIDIVYEILLRYYGIPLSAKIEKLDEIGERTYSIGSVVIVCLEDTITNDIIDKLSKIDFAKLYLRDSSFKGETSLELKQNLMTRLNLQKDYKDEKTYKVEFI